jgi:tRNA(fMet)-specific endonuclease VapC
VTPRVLLDSDVVIRFLNGTAPDVRERLVALADGEAALCSVVKAELLYGARSSARVDENLARLQELFAIYASLPFDDDAAEHYGVIRTQLRRAGTPIGGNDMLIAAIALAHDLAVATGNGREYRRVPGLRVLAW